MQVYIETIIWVHNYTTSGVQLPQSYSGKFASSMRTNMFVPSHFWTAFTVFDTCCWRYAATCRKFFV